MEGGWGSLKRSSSRLTVYVRVNENEMNEGQQFVNFQKEYQELRLKCETYSTALLSQCRHKNEVESVLKKNCVDAQQKRLRKFPYPRINRAIELGQKLVIFFCL